MKRLDDALHITPLQFRDTTFNVTNAPKLKKEMLLVSHMITLSSRCYHTLIDILTINKTIIGISKFYHSNVKTARITKR